MNLIDKYVLEIKSNINIFFASDEDLSAMCNELTSFLNLVNSSGKMYVLSVPNLEGDKSDILEPNINDKSFVKNIKKHYKSKVQSSIIKCYLVFYEFNNKILEASNKYKYLEINLAYDYVEKLYLSYAINNKYVKKNDIADSFNNTYDLISSNNKNIKKAEKMFGDDNAIGKYAYTYLYEENVPTVVKNNLESVETTEVEEKYYCVSSLFETFDDFFTLKYLLSLKDSINLCISFNKVSKIEVKADLSKKLSIRKGNFLLNKKKNEIDERELSTEIDNISTVANDYLKSMNQLFKVTIIFKNAADEVKFEDYTAMSSVYSIYINNLKMIQENARNIFCGDKLYDGMLYSSYQSSSQLAKNMIIPFTPLSEVDGIYLGDDSFGNHVKINPVLNNLGQTDSRTSKNLGIAGLPGQGKSFVAKRLISESSLYESLKYIFILDPHNEYSDIVRALGGKVVDFTMRNIPNPLYLIMSEEVDIYTEELTSKIGMIEKIMKELFENPQNKEHIFIASFFRVVYNHYFSNSKNKEFNLSFTESVDYGIDNHLYDESSEKYVKQLKTILNGSANIIDNKNASFDGDIVSFNLENIINQSSISDSLKKIVYLSITSFISQKMVTARATDGKDGLFITDEFNKLCNENDLTLADFYTAQSTQMRKYNFGMWLILHTCHDMKPLYNVFHSLQMKIIFHSNEKFDIMNEAYGITQRQYEAISTTNRGNAIIISGNSNSDVKIQKIGYEDELFGAGGGR